MNQKWNECIDQARAWAIKNEKPLIFAILVAIVYYILNHKKG
jgi:hypothetical protein